MKDYILKYLINHEAQILAYLWFTILAVWGSTAKYLAAIAKCERKFSLFQLLAGWNISALAGLITAFLCKELGFSFYVTSAAAGLAGHMGGGALSVFEDWFKKKFPGR